MNRRGFAISNGRHPGVFELPKTKRAKMLPGQKLHVWMFRSKEPGKNGRARWRCVYCDYLAESAWPHTPDGDPAHPCPRTTKN